VLFPRSSLAGPCLHAWCPARTGSGSLNRGRARFDSGPAAAAAVLRWRAFKVKRRTVPSTSRRCGPHGLSPTLAAAERAPRLLVRRPGPDDGRGGEKRRADEPTCRARMIAGVVMVASVTCWWM
jgi:hypothetical protein